MKQPDAVTPVASLLAGVAGVHAKRSGVIAATSDRRSSAAKATKKLRRRRLVEAQGSLQG
jgi:hypothetical protein